MKVQICFLKRKFKKSKKKCKDFYCLKMPKKSLQMVKKKSFRKNVFENFPEIFFWKIFPETTSQEKLSGKTFRKRLSGKKYPEK